MQAKQIFKKESLMIWRKYSEMTVSYFSFLNIIIIIVEFPNTWRLLEISFLSWNHLPFFGSAWLCLFQLSCAQLGVALDSSPNCHHTVIHYSVLDLKLATFCFNPLGTCFFTYIDGTTIACLLNRSHIHDSCLY